MSIYSTPKILDSVSPTQSHSWCGVTNHRNGPSIPNDPNGATAV